MAYSARKKRAGEGGRVHVMSGEREESACYCQSCSATVCVEHTILFLAWFYRSSEENMYNIMGLFRSARFDLIAVDAIGNCVGAGGGRRRRS
jgi:hypothetical protein